MTPAERVVVEAAIRWAAATADDALAYQVFEAVNALKAERAGTEPTEVDLTWGQVVESDEIYSDKTGKWYRVHEMARGQDGRVKIVAEGLPEPIRPKATDPIRVRRGATGTAVDVFASVLWSMPTQRPDPRGT